MTTLFISILILMMTAVVMMYIDDKMRRLEQKFITEIDDLKTEILLDLVRLKKELNDCLAEKIK